MTDTLTRPDGTATDGGASLDAKIPDGPLIDKWDTFIADSKLVNPSNKRKFKIIVVGTGLAGASAAATLAELGYQVEAFTFHDSPRRAHSIAAQGGINAAKNYRGDGDSVHRLFYDTIKGGDFRSREGNVYRLAQVSGNIIDQMVAQGVPFAREYGGLLDNRSFGGAQVSRTFYARGQTGQQLLLGAYQQMAQQVGLGNIKLWNRMELVDVVVIDGKCAGIVTRDLLNGEVSSHSAHAVVLATGGYGNAFFLSTNAMNCNVTAAWRAHRKGAYFANPCYTQIHPTCIPQAGDDQSKLTLMSESLRNDGRVWVPKVAGDEREAALIPEDERDYYLERLYPSFGNLAPRDISSRAAKRAVDSGRGVGPLKNGVNLDFADAIARLGENTVRERYGNLFEMYERITGENPYSTPMRIYPASHYTMGGLWVDYELMTSIPGLYCAGEANFSDHGANRLGASALMQGLADGYFVLPNTISNHLAPMLNKPIPSTDHPEFKSAESAAKARFAGYLSCGGTRSPDHFHRELGRIIWDYCGMDRNESGLEKALSEIPALYAEFQKDLRVTGSGENVNQTLEKAGRVDDFFQLGMLMCRDALERRESCGGHFRSEYQTEEGEALRDDENFAHVAAWEWTGDPMASTRHKEELEYENVHFQTRSYK
jgi:succinate dehydrogenase / fumarate reductase flavoprotein subunit